MYFVNFYLNGVKYIEYENLSRPIVTKLTTDHRACHRLMVRTALLVTGKICRNGSGVFDSHLSGLGVVRKVCE